MVNTCSTTRCNPTNMLSAQSGDESSSLLDKENAHQPSTNVEPCPSLNEENTSTIRPKKLCGMDNFDIISCLVTNLCAGSGDGNDRGGDKGKSTCGGGENESIERYYKLHACKNTSAILQPFDTAITRMRK